MDNPIIRIEKNDIQYFNTVDDIVGRAVAAGDPLIALEFIQGLQRDGFLRGLAIAKTFFRMKQAWALFEIAGVEDTFEGVVETTTGYSPETVNKYVRMWESIFENPSIDDDIKLLLAGKPIETLMLLTAAAREGNLNVDDWKDIANSSDIKEVRKKIQDRRGLQTSANRKRYITLYRRTQGDYAAGALVLMTEDGPKVLGFLKLDTGDLDIDEEIVKLINARNMREAF